MSFFTGCCGTFEERGCIVSLEIMPNSIEARREVGDPSSRSSFQTKWGAGFSNRSATGEASLGAVDGKGPLRWRLEDYAISPEDLQKTLELAKVSVSQ